MESEKHAKVPGGDPQAWLAGLNRAILDSALDCIITMDASGRVVEFNPAAERVFGYTREEAVGKELAELIIPVSLRERHRQGLKRYLKTGEGPVLGRRIEINALRADGSEILVELAITPSASTANRFSPRICATSPIASGVRKRVGAWPRSLNLLRTRS